MIAKARNCQSFINAIGMALLLLLPEATAAEITYNRDVLPILSAKCLTCHGADKASRKAGLRLDQARSAMAKRRSGPAVVPKKPIQSQLIQRIFSKDLDEVMPPPTEGKPLTPKEKQVLKQWIAQGAIYEKHWAFLPARKPPVPKAIWGNNEIDRFIFAALVKAGLSPQSPESNAKLLRRVTLDLTGLPPTIEELEEFLNDNSARPFERAVERLLASPRFGERMASWWLDGAHYGDSHGYDNDLENSQWPWRDWVVEAFNVGKPFDQFTIEQLAGDLLPDPTEDQILATGFNRNHRIQTEDGAIDEEWRTEYVVDRVETMATVWMGLTLGCCRCHDHKYDPISQREFYRLFALFNNLDEKGFINNLRGSAPPRIRFQAQKFNEAADQAQKQIKDKSARKKAMARLEGQYPWVMVMQEMKKPRKTYVLKRGLYNARGREVTPGLPEVLPPLPKGQKVTRLSLAQWLVNGNHPLTARVFVNRIWEQLFGIGLVESSENFGTRGEWPSHPALLDWLAVHFVESKWNIKALMRKIVLSATYQQSHKADAIRLRRDPQNRLLSRGPRARLSAEMIRDQALFLSGLLHEQPGGPGARPYQPAGLWKEIEKRGTYQQDHGSRLYRRSLYTAIRKTVPPPGMALFDLPSRELCTVKRSQTSTPLQALALMNNVTYVEAAKMLADRMMNHSSDPKDSIPWGFRRATLRPPTKTEMDVLYQGYQRRLALYQKAPQLAEPLLKQGETAVSAHHDKVKLAAMTTVAGVLLNLDELLHK